MMGMVQKNVQKNMDFVCACVIMGLWITIRR